MICQSLAQQYGILPADQPELLYPDWNLLVSGLLPESPLGQIVQLRTTKDTKHLTPAQRALRRAWFQFKATEADQAQLEALLLQTFAKESV